MSSFPHPFLADEFGFLAYGGSLNIPRMLLAYHCGIFPWYSRGPVCWFFTSPRCVVVPERVHISKSMNKLLRRGVFKTTLNQRFEEVVAHCATIRRKGSESTWITGEVYRAFMNLHKLGYAHSVEVWYNEQLAGGLYGLALGRIFYGESMFSLVPNASKYGFIHLCQSLSQSGYKLIDCQQKTDHMMSLGGEMMSRKNFWQCLKENMLADHHTVIWSH